MASATSASHSSASCRAYGPRWGDAAAHVDATMSAATVATTACHPGVGMFR
jgi:hypothetical protein